jgi:hypothetical protein
VRPHSRIRIRALVVLLATAAVLAPVTAASATVFRTDDGSREASVDFDYNDDYAAKHIWVTTGEEVDVKTATLWVYAAGQNCTASGGQETLQDNGHAFLTYDPCSIWSDSVYSWHAFDVPASLIVAGDNKFQVLDDAVTWTDRGAYFGMDTNSGSGYTAAYNNYTTVSGELMWFLVTTKYRGGQPARGFATIHRLTTGAATFALSPSSAGWHCVDVHNGASVATGSSLVVPNPGVQCDPSATYGEWCNSASAGAYQVAGGLGTLVVTSACTRLAPATAYVTLPTLDPNTSALVSGHGYTPWRCTVNDSGVATPRVDYLAWCGANLDTQNT